MKFTSATQKTRRVPPSHKPWTPHAYQERAVDFLLDHGSAALFLDPGLGKTSIVLESFRQLREARQAKRMLVVAPLRVCQLVWRQEGKKWSQFRDLKFCLLHGRKKEADLKSSDAEIFLINPEGVAWLCNRYRGRRLPFDTVVIDELTRFKNHQSKRAKALRPLLANVPRRWGLTGTPAPNGYMDLFGQMLMLDDGRALGRFITHYRDMYFDVGYDGFSYDLRHGAAKRIEDRIKDTVLRMSAKDYLDLPPLIPDPIVLEMDTKTAKTYSQMKEEMLIDLPDGRVTAANSAAVYSKLAQLANGAVYLTPPEDQPFDGKRDVAWVHDIKLDALAELVEDLNGQPLLIGYEFQHDLARLRARFPNLPYIGAGVSEKRVKEIEEAWNAGEMPILACHPASAGHGLNFQGCNAAHIAWFSATWDFELYDQFIKRILRQGNKALRILNHMLIVAGTIDELKYAALEDKDATQGRLLDGLNSAILPKGVSPAAGNAAEPTNEDPDMVKKLSRRRTKGDEEEQPRRTPKGWGKSAPEEDEDEDEQEEEQPRRSPKGWGKSAPRESDEDEDEDEDDGRSQRRRVRSKLRGDADEEEEDEDDDDGYEDPAAAAARLFAGGGDDDEEDEDDEDEQEEEPAPAPKKTRRTSPTAAQKKAAAEALEEAAAAATKPVRDAPPRTAESDQTGNLDYDRLAGAIVNAFFSRLLRK